MAAAATASMGPSTSIAGRLEHPAVCIAQSLTSRGSPKVDISGTLFRGGAGVAGVSCGAEVRKRALVGGFLGCGEGRRFANGLLAARRPALLGRHDMRLGQTLKSTPLAVQDAEFFFVTTPAF